MLWNKGGRTQTRIISNIPLLEIPMSIEDMSNQTAIYQRAIIYP